MVFSVSAPRLVQQRLWYVLLRLWDCAYVHICPTPYNRKQNVLGASLTKIIPYFNRITSNINVDYVVAAVALLSRYLSGPLPYVQCHITGNIMC